MAVAVMVDEDETSSFSSSPWTFDGAIDRGCLCDAAGHPHSVIQSHSNFFIVFANYDL